MSGYVSQMKNDDSNYLTGDKTWHKNVRARIQRHNTAWLKAAKSVLLYRDHINCTACAKAIAQRLN